MTHNTTPIYKKVDQRNRDPLTLKKVAELLDVDVKDLLWPTK